MKTLTISEAWDLATGVLWPYIDKTPKLYYGYHNAKTAGQKLKYLQMMGFEFDQNDELRPPGWISKLIKACPPLTGEIQIIEFDWFEKNGKPMKWIGRIGNVPVFEITSFPRRGLNKYTVEYQNEFSFISKKSYYHQNQQTVFDEISSFIRKLIIEIKTF